MRLLLLNPPHPSIGSRIPGKSLPPLGLLAIGGTLIDAGHDVTLLDADIDPLSLTEVVRRVCEHQPEVLLVGHTGSTSAHPVVVELTHAIRSKLPLLVIVYGGVFPTYHYREILCEEPQVDIIVRGEGEETAPKLLAAMEAGADLNGVDGIAFRESGRIVESRPAQMISDLDAYRVGWELLDFSRYTDYGGTTRADDIARDADILHLYRKAGVEKFVLGIENTDEATLKKIRKGGATKTDREAIRAMRKNGIISLAAWVADFEEVTDRDMFRSLRQLLAYDPDQMMALFVTPHRWTGFYTESAGRRVIQLDQRRWDYKHQVLATSRMSPLRVMLWSKFIETVLQTRPKALWRTYFQPDSAARRGMRWYARMGRTVWFREWYEYFRVSRITNGPTLQQFWGAPQERQDIPLLVGAAKAGEKTPVSRS